jgi:hypothetical protein
MPQVVDDPDRPRRTEGKGRRTDEVLPEREDEGVVSTRDKADPRCVYSSATGEAMLRPGQAGSATG